MGFLSLLALTAIHHQVGKPLLWVAPSGQIEVAGKPVKYRLTPGASRVKVVGGYAYNFTGARGGLLIDDLPELKLTETISVSVWLKLRSYVNDGPGAQVLFRGDDRNGLDPYTLSIHGDGTVHFAVQNDQDQGFGVAAEIPLNRWVHIFATFDAKAGELDLWLNHEKYATARTTRRPFSELDPAYAPGIGIGNVQNDHGPHNQPLNGLIADLRVYDRLVDVDDLDIGGAPWDNPPAAMHRSRNTVQ